jgi:hypothetical protein
MVGLPSHGLESQNYFSTKQNKGARAAASDSRNSPKSSKFQQTRPLSQYNGQNLNMSQPKLKSKSPSVNKQSNKQHSGSQNTTATTSPKPIPQNKNSRNNQSSLRSSPSSTRSSPPRSTISPSRSSPNNFASSQCYQPPLMNLGGEGGRSGWRKGRSEENSGCFWSSCSEGWAWGRWWRWCSDFQNVACWIVC